MNTDLYFEIYNEILSRGNDTDETECLMSDLEDALQENPYLDAWEWFNDHV